VILEKLQQVKSKNDPSMTLLVEYGDQGWSFNPKGTLFSITTQLSIMEKASNENVSIPVSDPVALKKVQ
jgi:hypothetical protein